MFTNLTYRLKFIILAVGFVLFLIISYNLAFKKTFSLKSECNEIEARLEQSKNAPQQIALIKSKLEEIDRKVGGKSIDQINLEELIIEHISSFCKLNDLVLKEYPGIHNYSQQDYTTETCKLTVEGSFIKLLKLAYGIEQDFSYGKVSSLNFYTEKNYKTKKVELLLEIYVQNIKMRKHE
ncbi:MAG TPA: hypothetical protein DCG75_05100 [Bacteroidales bacterium]|nr:hypothetical protein [Bacteroidales bacterium]